MSKKGCFWVSLLLLVLFLGGGGLCGGIGYFAFNMAKAPLEAVVKEINQDPEISAKLGSPVESESSWGITDFVNNNGNGHAEVDFNVNGSLSGANVKGRVNLTANVWRSENVTVTCDDGTVFTLPRGQSDGENGAADNGAADNGATENGAAETGTEENGATESGED